MKKLILILLLLIPVCANAQIESNSPISFNIENYIVTTEDPALGTVADTFTYVDMKVVTCADSSLLTYTLYESDGTPGRTVNRMIPLTTGILFSVNPRVVATINPLILSTGIVLTTAR